VENIIIADSQLAIPASRLPGRENRKDRKAGEERTGGEREMRKRKMRELSEKQRREGEAGGRREGKCLYLAVGPTNLCNC